MSSSAYTVPSLCDLHTPSKTGNLSRVKFLLSQRQADVNCQDWIGKTPVIWAASEGHTEVVELLVSNGANVSHVDRFGINILHAACLGGYEEVVKYVLSQNTLDINGRARCGRTAVMMAAENGHKDMVELLVDKGSDMSLMDERGDNILHCACKGGDVEGVEYILSQEMVNIDSLRHRKKTPVIVDINSRGWRKRTPVMVAAEHGHKEVVELLIQHGTDLSLNEKVGNILHNACYSGHFHAVKCVLSLNLVEIKSRGWTKRIPVMIAAKLGNKEVVEFLVKNKANLSLRDENGENILHLASYNGHVGVVKYVLSLNSVDINGRGMYGVTAAMAAAAHGQKEVVELLVEHGADVLLSDGENILHIACYEGHYDVVKYLLSLNSVDVNSRGEAAITPVMTAAEDGQKEVVELLVEHGADLLLSDIDGDNILHKACYEGHLDVVKYLLSLNSVDINSRGMDKRTPVMAAAERPVMAAAERPVMAAAERPVMAAAERPVIAAAEPPMSAATEPQMMAAAEHDQKEVVELLVNHGANLSISDIHGDNILHYACYAGHFHVVKYLLSLNTVDINGRGKGKITPVMAAAEYGQKEVVELLVNHGANLLLSNMHGDNILHYACYAGHFDVVKYLVSLNSVDINSRGKGKRTPVMAAAKHGHKKVVELLVKHGADTLLSDEQGKKYS